MGEEAGPADGMRQRWLAAALPILGLAAGALVFGIWALWSGPSVPALVAAASFAITTCALALCVLVLRRYRRLKHALEVTPGAIAIYDRHDRLQYCNARYASVVKLPRSAMRRGLHYTTIVRRALETEVASDELEAEVDKRYRIHRAQDGVGSDRLYPGGRMYRVQKIRMRDGSCMGIAVDVTELYETRAALETELARFSALTAESPAGICQLDGAGTVTFANRSLLDIFGARNVAALRDAHLSFEAEGVRWHSVVSLLEALRGEASSSHGVAVTFGEDRHLVVRFASVPSEAAANGGGAKPQTTETLFIILDETERVRAQAKVHHLALHDALTGAKNRIAFNRDLEAAVTHADAARPLALVALDLDRFKPVNDGHGHGAGDELLVAVVRRLTAAVGAKGSVYRIGGDEFSLLLRGADGPAALTLAQQALAEVAKPLSLRRGAATLTVGASAGVCLLPQQASSADGLIDGADRALYAAKHGGGNQAVLYDETVHSQPADGSRSRTTRPPTELPGRGRAIA